MKKIIRITLCLICVNILKAEAQRVDASYLNPITGAYANYKYLRFGNESNSYGGFMWNNTVIDYGDGDDFTIYTYSNRDLVLQAFQGNILMFPNSEPGKVGIGTTSNPTAALSIKGRSSSRVLDGYNAANNLMFQINTSGGSPVMDFYNSEGATVNLKLNTSGNSFFNGGNVGIGTLDPQYLLHLDAQNTRNGISLTSGSNGYVFSDLAFRPKDNN